MKLYDLDTVLTFGQYKGEMVLEILKKNSSYITDYCLKNGDDFYITDAVWEALDCHKGLNDVLKSGEINTQVVKDVIAKNKKFHEDKRERYRSNILEE